MTYLPKDVTVIMCTSNRPSKAHGFVVDFIKKFPDVKLIVVENSNNDNNFFFLLDITKNFNLVEILRSSPPGLSRARNLGVSRVQTELVAFTDDDCVPDEDWIAEIASSRLWEEASAIGGKIQPLFLQQTPDLEEELMASLAILDLGHQSRILDSSEYLFGANMAFKTEIFRQFQFDTNLGRTGNLLLSGEEILLQNEMLAKGLKVGYEPCSIVSHVIEPERVSPSWFLKRFAWQGVSDAFQNNAQFEWIPPVMFDLANQLQLGDLIHELTSNNEAGLRKRAQLVRYLVYTLLTQDSREFSIHGRNPAIQNVGRYPPSGKDMRHLVVDFRDFHDFLIYGLRHKTIGSYLIDKSPWEISKEDLMNELATIYYHLINTSRDLTLTFLSLDSFLHPDYFEQFDNFIQALPNEINGCLHRPPANAVEMKNLAKISRRLKLFTWSKMVAEELQMSFPEIKSLPVLSQIPSTTLNFTKLAKKSERGLRIAFAGELRATTQIKFVSELLKSRNLSPIPFQLVIIGATRSKEMNKGMLNLKNQYPEAIDLTFFTFYTERYRAIEVHEYIKALKSCDVGCKIQMEESFAGSAVVADFISMGLPIITLTNTEASSSIEHLFRDLILPKADHISFFNALPRILELKPIDHFREQKLRQDFVMGTLFGL
jgi:glucosyl-dolichyl phosphate glucuronosyltransferase